MKTFFLAAASILLVSCASMPATTSEDVAEQRSFRTGSHLPLRDPTSGSSTVTSSAPPPVNVPSVYIPGKGGGS